MNPTDDRASEALRWISDVFVRAKAEYQVVGGLAARAFGATRTLVDPDFYVRGSDLERVLVIVSEYCVWGPEHYQDDAWDLTFVQLEWHGVKIELAEAEGAKYYDSARQEWIDQGVDFDRSDRREVKTPPYFAAALEGGARPDVEMREKFGGFRPEVGASV